MNPGLQLKGISKSFDGLTALEEISFEVAPGEIVGVLGPSGCGKSTLLMVIAGLEHPDQGEVMWNGETLKGIPPHQRGFGLMFQDLALFPHRNVFENVAFGLRMAGKSKDEVHQRVHEVLTLVGLEEYGRREVHTLSGGESQRVALARALAPRPRLLMLDEPLGALDRNLREHLVTELRRILKASSQTAIYVTHDQEEAFTVSDRVVVMSKAHIEQVDTPQKVYQHPASQFVARFLGFKNLFPGEVIQKEKDGALLKTSLGDFPIDTHTTGKVTVLLRPDHLNLEAIAPYRITAKVRSISFRGSMLRIEGEVQGNSMAFELSSQVPPPAVGEEITLYFQPEQALQVFPEVSGQKYNVASNRK